MNPANQETSKQLQPEWYPQWGIMLAWPDVHTDWRDLLDEAQACYTRIAEAISQHANLLILCQSEALQQQVQQQLHLLPEDRLHYVVCSYNDTWARDFGPLTVSGPGYNDLELHDFQFNGWGNKFNARDDNAVNQQLADQSIWNYPLHKHQLVLEGGSIEVNGKGVLLTTSACLLNKNRNPELNQSQLEQQVKKILGVKEICWLQYGELAGDDTDSHIDTLARFCADDLICYVQCQDPTDEHYPELTKMEQELLTYCRGADIRTRPLPLPEAIYHPVDGYRLPATYANFLIVNDAVLVPVYQQPTDQQALDVLRDCFPKHKVTGIDCSTLIKQHGSLHCVTMQLPKGAVAEINKDKYHNRNPS